MRRNLLAISIGVAILAASGFQAHATATCLKEKQPFALASDTMLWKMSLAAGEDCIQGLRWSYMQIYEVTVVNAPSKGKLIIVGSGFRYAASESKDGGADKFTLLISGKNRHDVGKSTLEVEVYPDGGEIRVGTKRAPKFASVAAVGAAN